MSTKVQQRPTAAEALDWLGGQLDLCQVDNARVGDVLVVPRGEHVYVIRLVVSDVEPRRFKDGSRLVVVEVPQ